jgi:NAD(P)-dependent dehydrogenase (short-subunit alcohol dehydrogenase family)
MQTLVTGSSSGAGAEIAREFGRLGAHAAVHCRSNLAAAEQVAAEIRAKAIPPPRSAPICASRRRPAISPRG